MPMSIQDVLLPKYVSDSCYASITQIYRDMFELTPKSNLKLSSSNSSRASINLGSGDKHKRFLHNDNERGMRTSRVLSLSSLKKPSLTHAQYNIEKDMRRSERKFEKSSSQYGGNSNGSSRFQKSDRKRASWHEGDSKRNVVGTKIEFVTRF